MDSQTVTERGLHAWVSFLHAHATVSRALNAELVTQHGLTINDYEVLLVLSRAPDRRLKRIELAQRVLLTPSGITRLLDGLQSSGYVEKGACASDARVTYAVLTDAGLEKLREAAGTHLRDVEEQFSARFTDDELAVLATLLGRLGTAEEGATCAPD